MLLVRDRKESKIRLLFIYIDPWKDINYSEPFDVQENIFAVKNSSLFMPKNDLPCMYSADKIKSVFILTRELKKVNIATLIVQFWHSIFTLSIDGSNTRRLTDVGNMVHEFAIQSHLNKIFFAEKNIDRSDIYMLEISKKNQRVNKRKIFSLDCRLVAMEADSSNEIM